MEPLIHDAHNHLQDSRLAGRIETIVAALTAEGVGRVVINGSCEEDWGDVLALARRFPQLILPAFGYHPWRLKERTPDWQRALARNLDLIPSAIGEIGLDRWIENHDPPEQESVFVWQLRLAAERNLPASIHCLKAWGRLYEILRAEPRPRRGFLLHSYGGPKEMIQPLAALGAYFSLPGSFAHDRKRHRRETFRHVPRERLLIETDAPDQPLPESRVRHRLVDEGGEPLNHPANIRAVYEFAAEWLGEPVEDLAPTVAANFERLFG